MSRNERLLACGVLSALLYPAADILAGSLYPGYSFRSQAVSELFAIGAPTSRIVVPLFTLCSLLLVAYAAGVWLIAGRQRALRLMAISILINAVDALLLWNFFPMHMRGDERTFTDTMHLVLAANPFVVLSIVFAAVAFKGWLRLYSTATIFILFVPAAFSFTYVSAVAVNGPTPWLGFLERFAQYAYNLWQAIVAVHLMSAMPGRELTHSTV